MPTVQQRILRLLLLVDFTMEKGCQAMSNMNASEFFVRSRSEKNVSITSSILLHFLPILMKKNNSAGFMRKSAEVSESVDKHICISSGFNRRRLRRQLANSTVKQRREMNLAHRFKFENIE
ncbi:hypothetical protein AVEN_124609-1 [Araneus ventricosus]|uniref:Uncharacterized protein n=1 Tax=Araneus ventricosus TaxID=182803 RepID=A0A4Y2KU69_ARAVE|nr:hypothetical protein AVEN_124609-1 [Araneus ventricosus]